MQRKVWALGIVLILCLSMGVSTQTAVEQNEINEELKWWDKDLIWLERNHHLFNNIDKVIECD